MAEESLGVVTPSTPVAATEATPAPVSPADQVSATPIEGDEPSKPAGKTYSEEEHQKAIQKRIGVESRKLERIARAEARAELAERQLQELQKPKEAAPAGRPDPKDFKDFDSYHDALTDWKVDQKLSKRTDEAKRETDAQQQARMERERGETLKQRFADAEAKYPDFRDVLADPDLPFNGPILAYIEDSKIGGDVAYHLAQNKAEAFRIAGLSPIQQVLALNALESKLTAAPAPTRTPEPIVPNSGNAPSRKGTFELSVKNQSEWDEFVKRRHKELGRRR